MSQKNTAYQRLSADQRRQELIEATIRCLGKGGMSAFTIDQICRAANVSRGLINHHFKTKNDLLLAVYDNMTRYLLEGDQQSPPEVQISSFIRRSFDETTFDKSALRAWLAIWGEVATNETLKALHQQRYDIYRYRLESAVDAIAEKRRLQINANSVARNLIALIDGLWLEYCLHDEGFSLSEAREDCHRMIERYLGKL